MGYGVLWERLLRLSDALLRVSESLDDDSVLQDVVEPDVRSRTLVTEG